MCVKIYERGDNTVNLSENIKFFRKKKGMTQKDLAEILDVTTRTIQNYESDNREPSIDILTKIAAALEIPLSELLEDDTFNLTGPEDGKVDAYLDFIIGKPELKPLVDIFKNKGYELRPKDRTCDIYLIKDDKIIGEISEDDFADFGTKMLYVINEFTDFEFKKLIETFDFLSK